MNSNGEPPPEPAIEDLEDLDDLSEQEAGPDLTVGPPGSRKCRACRTPVLPGTRQCPGCGASIPKVNPWDFVLVGGALFLICGGIHLFSGFWLRGIAQVLHEGPSFEEQTRQAREHLAERAAAEDGTWVEEFGNEVLRSGRVPDADTALEGAVAQVRLFQRASFYGALLSFCLLAFGFLKLLVRR